MFWATLEDMACQCSEDDDIMVMACAFFVLGAYVMNPQGMAELFKLSQKSTADRAETPVQRKTEED